MNSHVNGVALDVKSLPVFISSETGSNRLALFQIKASSSEESSGSAEVGEGFSDLKEKWDALEDKYMFILYGGGAIVALWLSSIVVDAINSVPLVGDLA
ncbi:hypothetical protein C3L33_03298, partial [Rhododendron williamsianum]